MKPYLSYFLLFVILLGFTGCKTESITSQTPTRSKVVKYPEKIDPNCHGGTAKLYDECSDQIIIFSAALQTANEQGKTLLVSYGAEWCIWCHVFEAYIRGKKGSFNYTYAAPNEPDNKFTSTLYEREKTDVSQEANELYQFVSNNFVLAHIENLKAPNGETVLDQTNARQHFSGGIPFIFTTDKQGNFAAAFISDRAETRRDTDDWYRGYDRKKLTQELQRMKDAAVK